MAMNEYRLNIDKMWQILECKLIHLKPSLRLHCLLHQRGWLTQKNLWIHLIGSLLSNGQVSQNLREFP